MKRFSFLQKLCRPTLGPPSRLCSGYRSSYPRVKRPGRDVDHWPVPAEAKNEWSCTSTPPICVRSVDKDSSTFYFLLFVISCALTNHSFPLSPWPAVPIGSQSVLQSSLSCIKDHFVPPDLIFSTEEGGSRFFWNVDNIATSTRPCRSKNGITITPRLVTLVICLSSRTLYRICLLAYVCHPRLTSFQMYNEVSNHTQQTLLLMLITWQLVSTSGMGHHQTIVQEHVCIQKINTMRWEISPCTLITH